MDFLVEEAGFFAAILETGNFLGAAGLPRVFFGELELPGRACPKCPIKVINLSLI